MTDQTINEGCPMNEPCQHTTDTREEFRNYVQKMNGSLDRLWQQVRDNRTLTQAEVKDMGRDIKADFEKALGPIRDEMAELKRRLPLWASAFGGAMTATIGYLIAKLLAS